MLRIPILLACLFIISCKTPGVREELPALLTNPGRGSLQQIEQAVSAATGSANVTLAPDVFTKSSVLVIQRSASRGIDRAPEPGRDVGHSYRFRLMTAGAECLLLDELTGQHRVLLGVECIRE